MFGGANHQNRATASRSQRPYPTQRSQESRERISREETSSMPVLKAPPKQPRTTVVQLRLDDEARMKLTKYAGFLECSPSYVVSEALKLVYAKDKEFQSWLLG